MRFVTGVSLLSAATTLLLSAPAGAVQTPAAFAHRPPVEVAQGAPLRLGAELVWHRVPAEHRAAWAALKATMGPQTWAVWDRDTGVVRRIWGEGIAAAGVMGSAEAAERVARRFLAEHLALLAPGASIGDFELVANHLGGGIRSVGFVQRAGGVPVEGGQVSFRFKNDRLFMIGSEALPWVPRPAARAVSDEVAAAAALAWVRGDLAPGAELGAVAAPRVLPLVRAGSVEYRAVIPVEVSAASPRGRWTVYVDAARGEPVARVQTLLFAQGVLNYNAPERQPAGARKDFPADQANVTVNGAPATTSAQGSLTWGDNNPANVVAKATGKQIRVKNQAGGDASGMVTINPGQSGAWNAAGDADADAQVTTYVHANKVINYARGIDAGQAFFSQIFDAKVNINDSCNAFYDGQAINFFRQSGQCNNTGRIADIVYHEYGHGVHDHAVIQGVGFFDTSVSEGVSDYLAATITGDPAMGGGFFLGSSEALRHLDPPKDSRWPEDVNPDPHITGLIIGEALWDLRKALIEDQGAGAVALADHLYYEAIRRAVDIPSMYFEVLAADDDDGDLANGTPNMCLINDAFARHGLFEVEADVSGPAVANPLLNGYEVSAALAGGADLCPGSGVKSADLTWRLREQQQVGGVIPMDIGDAQITATIPQQAAGSVVQYQVKVTFEGGGEVLYPDNRADPFFEFFVGAVEEIYCTDFESDPAADGWTHGLSAGEQGEGADDWMWAVPMAGPSSGDPEAAFDGSKVFGNDLGGGNYNGTYQPDKTNYALSPMIDTTGYGQVRLQYRRWLTVEDGYFDRASIYANGQVAWQNRKTPNEADASVHHTDKVWRFHDVDLTPFVQNDAVQVKYEIKSDPGLEMGGWTLDALCVVGVVEGPSASCGDGIVSAGEACDEGAQNSDVTPDACRSDCTLPACGDGVMDSGELCDDGNTVDGDACPADCGGGSETSTGGTSDGGSTDGGASDGGTSDGGATGGASGDGTDGATGGSGGADEEGCGCTQGGGEGRGAWLLGLGLLGLWRRRRR